MTEVNKEKAKKVVDEVILHIEKAIHTAIERSLGRDVSRAYFNIWFTPSGKEITAYVRLGVRNLLIHQGDKALLFNGDGTPTLQLANVECHVSGQGIFTELMAQMIALARQYGLMFMVENMHNPIVDHVAIEKFGMYRQVSDAFPGDGLTGANAWMLVEPYHSLLMQLVHVKKQWASLHSNYRQWEAPSTPPQKAVEHFQKFECAMSELNKLLNGPEGEYKDVKPQQEQVSMNSNAAKAKTDDVLDQALYDIPSAQVTTEEIMIELLELAAKAIKVEIACWDRDLHGIPVAILADGHTYWQPLLENTLTDCMGDALRLAADLELSIDSHPNDVRVWNSNDWVIEDCPSVSSRFSRQLAFRRAIVRAAAALGMATMKEQGHE